MDPIAAENWLEAIETAFHFMNCPPKYEVHCGTYMLKGEAHFWWKGAQKTIVPQGEFITWCQFKDTYLHNYYPITARVKMQAAFLALKQGDRSVGDYDLEFNRLARFSPAYVSSEELKGERFIAGLREELRGNVASQSSFVYTKALQVATLLDSPRTDKLQLGIAQSSHTAAQGKGAYPSHPRTGRPPRGRTDRRGRAPVRNMTLCPNCRRPHTGECRAGTGACYRCGQVGHFAVDCPQRNDQRVNLPAVQHQRGQAGQHQQGRAVAHATIARQADQPDAVVTGTLPVFGHLALVLFDSGSTHSFVSEEFVELAQLEKELLEITLSVSTPAHELLLATHRVKGGIG
ncbi:uncharacterized protein LOC111453916 [Cucurbita moschata]|uniref:Uncharacterized protein LOC111453916 n=1 Tax=Cucurbita moschata TaxID=3662 RepID=A0A6J1GG88_CUCMO|nr:uncharacterized protein LOC111453916 [Cucurbita moschata]